MPIIVEAKDLPAERGLCKVSRVAPLKYSSINNLSVFDNHDALDFFIQIFGNFPVKLS